MAKIMTCEVVSRADEVIAALRRQVALGLESIGQEAEGYAKDECPVDTGRLRNSISHEVQEDEVYIGTNVEYAPYVEFNEKARHDPPQFGGGKAHFLRDAAANHGDHYKEIMEAALKA